MKVRHAILAMFVHVAIQPAALAGAWPQQPGYGFAINQSGYGFAADGRKRIVFDGYAEAGLGYGLTAIFLFDSDLSPDTSQFVWRAGGGLRASFSTDLLPGWMLSAEASVRYQGHESLVVDPVFAGDGVGYGGRIDAGRSFEVFDLNGFFNVSSGYVYRSMAPGEIKLEAVAGLDLDEDWQIGAGYFGSIAPGEFFEPGAYEKHEVQAYLRWRIDVDYAVAISVAQTVAVARTADETTFRLALWTYFYPPPPDGGD